MAALGTDTITSNVSSAFDAASGTTTTAVFGLIVAAAAVGVFVWAGSYVIRTFATGLQSGDVKHIFSGIVMVVLVVFTMLYIINYIKP